MRVNTKIVNQIKKSIEEKNDSILEVIIKRNILLEIALVMKLVLFNLFNIKATFRQFSDKIDLTNQSYKNDIQLIDKSVRLYFFSQIPLKLKTFIYLVKLFFHLLFEKLNNNNKFFYQYFLPYYYYLLIKSTGVKNIIFHYYSFVPEISALLDLLNSDSDIDLTYHEYCSFIDESLSVRAKTIIVPNSIVSEYYLSNKKIFYAEEYLCENDIEYYYKQFSKNIINNNDLVFISSGYYERLVNSKINKGLLAKGIISEDNILNQLFIYADLNKFDNIYISPHYARNIEDENKALKHYKKYLTKNSIKLFKNHHHHHLNYNLGITVSSNVFWERLELGQKTIIYNPPICKDYIRNTSLKNVTINNSHNVISKIEEFRIMNNLDYFNRIFNYGK